MRGKAACERAFGVIRSLLFEKLPGYTGVDVADRGADPEGDARLTAEEMEHLIHAAFTKRWKTFLFAQAVTLLSSVSILFRPWLYFAFSREHLFLGVEYLCAIYLVTNLINMLPHTPGGLGIMETAMVGLFSITDMGADHATAYQLCGRFADVVLIVGSKSGTTRRFL